MGYWQPPAGYRDGHGSGKQPLYAAAPAGGFTGSLRRVTPTAIDNPTRNHYYLARWIVLDCEGMSFNRVVHLKLNVTPDGSTLAVSAVSKACLCI